MHLVNYQITMFPRYKYHLELIEKHKKEYDICIPPPSTILVYGREAEVSRNLLQPLELHSTTFKGDLNLIHLGQKSFFVRRTFVCSSARLSVCRQ